MFLLPKLVLKFQVIQTSQLWYVLIDDQPLRNLWPKQNMFYQKNIDEMERPKLNMFQKRVYVIVF
jgi:hypothetical protein